MEVPTIVLPDIVDIETVEIPLPTADVPYYKPMVVPPSDLRDQPRSRGLGDVYKRQAVSKGTSFA